MSKITDYTALVTPASGDILVIVDVSDTTQSAAGTTKQITLANAAAGITPMTTLGDLTYENSTPAPARLAGNTTATKNYLTQTGTGSVSAAPGWGTISAGDVPTLNQNTTGTAANLTGGATFPAYIAPAVSTLTDASTVTVNAALGNDFRLLTTSGLGGSRTMGNPSNSVDGQMIEFQMTQAASWRPLHRLLVRQLRVRHRRVPHPDNHREQDRRGRIQIQRHRREMAGNGLEAGVLMAWARV